MGVHLSKKDDGAICSAFFLVVYGKFCGLNSFKTYCCIKFIWIVLNVLQIIIGVLQKDLNAPLALWLIVGGFVHFWIGSLVFCLAHWQEEHPNDLPPCKSLCFMFIYFLLHVAWVIAGICLLVSNAQLLTDEKAFIMTIVSLCFSFIPLLVFDVEKK